MPRPNVVAVNNYGLDAELAAKANAKYDPALETEAREWITSLTGTRFMLGFAETLKDGSVLCDLVNKVQANSVRRVYRGDKPFKQMENVSAFINAARRLGVAESDLFTTVALYEAKDMGQVVTCILALKRVATSSSRTNASTRSRRFLSRRDDASVSKLNMGSYGVMDTPHRAVVSESNRAGFASGGQNPNAGVSRLNNGSYGVMRATSERSPMTESNRAQFARQGSMPSNPAPRTVQRGPNSAYGVMREMSWERPSSSASSSQRRDWREELAARANRPVPVPVNASNHGVPPRPPPSRPPSRPASQPAPRRSRSKSLRKSVAAWLFGSKRSSPPSREEPARGSVRNLTRAFEDRSRAVRESRAACRRKPMKRVYFPDDCDLTALCKRAGVDADFDKDGVALVFANVQETALRRDEALGVPSVRCSPFASQNKCHAYFVYTDDKTGATTHTTREHPNAKTCYDAYYQIARERALKEAALLQGLENDVHERQRRIAQRNLVHQRALLEAELHYKETIGDFAVEDIDPSGDPGTVAYWRLAPRDIKRAARDVFDVELSEEPHLAWVVRRYLAHDLPPRWKRAENAPQVFVGDTGDNAQAHTTQDPSLFEEAKETEEETPAQKALGVFVVPGMEANDECFVYTPTNPSENDLVTSTHPGVTFFRGMIKAAREEHDIFAQDDQSSHGLSSDKSDDNDDEEEEDEDDDEDSVETLDVDREDEEPGDAERRGVLRFWHAPSQMYYRYAFGDGSVEHDILGPCPAVFISLRPRTATPLGQAPEPEQEPEQEEIRLKALPDIEARRIALAASLEDVWQAVDERVPKPDLDAFAQFVGVRLCGEKTDFLREIALSLLTPLPEGWIRTRDPEGRVHYCNTKGKLEQDLWRESLQDALPRWVRRAVELGHPVRLRSYDFSRLHPDAEACRDLIARERTVRKARAKKNRIAQRRLRSEQMQVSRRQLMRGDTMRLAAMEAAAKEDPMEQALKFYTAQIGDPTHPSQVYVVTTSAFRSPQMLFAEARRMGVKADDLDLLWIPHMRMAVELPPGWSEVDEGSFYHEPSGLTTAEHPADRYFSALVASARLNCRASRSSSRGSSRGGQFVPQHVEFLEMIDHAGTTYYFNPKTMRKQLSVPPLTPKMTRQHSTSCLNTSKMSTLDPHMERRSPVRTPPQSAQSTGGGEACTSHPGSSTRGGRLLPLSKSLSHLDFVKEAINAPPKRGEATSLVSELAEGLEPSFSDALARMIDENSSEASTKRSLVPPRDVLLSESFEVTNDDAFGESIQSLFGGASSSRLYQGRDAMPENEDDDNGDDDEDDDVAGTIFCRPPLKPKVSYFVQDWIDEQQDQTARGRGGDDKKSMFRVPNVPARGLVDGFPSLIPRLPRKVLEDLRAAGQVEMGSVTWQRARRDYADLFEFGVLTDPTFRWRKFNTSDANFALRFALTPKHIGFLSWGSRRVRLTKREAWTLPRIVLQVDKPLVHATLGPIRRSSIEIIKAILACCSAKNVKNKASSIFSLLNNYAGNSRESRLADAVTERVVNNDRFYYGASSTTADINEHADLMDERHEEKDHNEDNGENGEEQQDALESLYKHIRFLQRCSSDGRICAGEDPSAEPSGLHPGLFAKLPVTYVTLGSLQPPAPAKLAASDKVTTAARKPLVAESSRASAENMEDWLAARCASCESLLHDVTAQVLLKLPCGHHLHHECGRKWFAANKHCPVRGCGLAIETHATLEREQAKDAREQHAREHTDIEHALRCVLSQRNPTARVEYDGVAVDGATGSLRTCSGTLKVEMDAAGRLAFPGEIEADQVVALIHSLYQGSVVVTSSVVPIRHACHLPSRDSDVSAAPLTSSGAPSKPTRVVPAPGPMRTASCDEAAISKLVAERSSVAAEAAFVAADSAASRIAGRFSMTGFKQGISKALQSSRNFLAKNGQATPLLGEPCDCAIDTFTQVHSFTVKGGALFQRSAFANAVHMTSLMSEDSDFSPLPTRVLYM
ncbi:Calponin-1 [Hondaea fermentalgiana]|uniref:Calponin-1 n=1 Tax=Hondaea fermentalgiana TaxID=2315210 RepID=A0A2R5GNN9_9STRA|nr:Calponin-1 [Hondaea fermentalgiana]|eukprot:GBG31358.1 Calponin-1 [Hondaea fermentalgiana]